MLKHYVKSHIIFIVTLVFYLILVHGFVNAKYDVVEEDLLQSSFQLNVKGNTKLNQISVSGIITTTAGGTSSE